GRTAAEVVRCAGDEGAALLPGAAPVVGSGRVERVELRAVRRVYAVLAGAVIAERCVGLRVRGLDSRQVGLESDGRVIEYPAYQRAGEHHRAWMQLSVLARTRVRSRPVEPVGLAVVVAVGGEAPVDLHHAGVGTGDAVGVIAVQRRSWEPADAQLKLASSARQFSKWPISSENDTL